MRNKSKSGMEVEMVSMNRKGRERRASEHHHLKRDEGLEEIEGVG